MKRINAYMRIINIVLGIALVGVGIWLMFDFLLQFFKFVIGVLLLSAGVYLIMKKWE